MSRAELLGIFTSAAIMIGGSGLCFTISGGQLNAIAANIWTAAGVVAILLGLALAVITLLAVEILQKISKLKNFEKVQSSQSEPV